MYSCVLSSAFHIMTTSVCLVFIHPQVPWDDLRYIFGEIMYGGHIVEDWDRRLANR